MFVIALVHIMVMSEKHITGFIDPLTLLVFMGLVSKGRILGFRGLNFRPWNYLKHGAVDAAFPSIPAAHQNNNIASVACCCVPALAYSNAL